MPEVEYLNFDVVDENEWSIEDEDIFEKAAAADLEDEDYGVLEVEEGEFILDAAEDEGFNWPFYCREGKCAVCGAEVLEGEIEMPDQEIITEKEKEEDNVRLTCGGTPVEDDTKIIYNAKHLNLDWYSYV
ncbi:ferredoxin [Halorhabdus utahensis DSM 12940]|uniref:Ferredoxin n=1 Tax=Halorhabdus utahensis (strain DSM 12940 / JCM 11049 / AX-2) TaxID=519442 RepID=C7NSZ2_HALUD|nr:ferredoxin Fer [Halorhabdus utahensis]ACV12067.1 ferredoxin [Halorhabdus utahensis DSM 12940]